MGGNPEITEVRWGILATSEKVGAKLDICWYLWVPRNAKALKCISAAGEGIEDRCSFQYIGRYIDQ